MGGALKRDRAAAQSRDLANDLSQGQGWDKKVTNQWPLSSNCFRNLINGALAMSMNLNKDNKAWEECNSTISQLAAEHVSAPFIDL